MIGNNSSQSDEILVKLIKQGDARAFKELYYRYYNQLFRYAYYRVFEAESARDLMQDLFTKLWNKRTSLTPHKSIQAYLYKSLTNMIINQKQLKSSQNISYDEISENLSISEPDLNITIDIRTAINLLPQNIQTVFILSRVEGYKYREIADLLDLSTKAVEKRMSQALTILRKQFK